MSFSFSSEFTANTFTAVENAFISQYLPLSTGNSVKVYLFGLYLCNKKENDINLSSMAEQLSLTEQEIKSCFLYWEEVGLINVISFEPLSITYLPIKISQTSKIRKFKAEKYTEFTKSLQALLPSRMISTNEFAEYFYVMETYKILPEAMLLIVKYCVDKKGGDISYKYVSKVAKDFGERSINTIEKVEKELSSYVLRTSVLEKILSGMSIKRKPDIEDLNLLKKWTEELQFETENIIFAAKQLKRGSIQKLDEFLLELYSLKCFSKEEIKNYASQKQSVYDLAVKINRALSIYVEVLDTEIETYINKWVSFGFMEDALLLIASRLFRAGKNTLVDMDESVTYLRERGFIDLSSVNDFFEEKTKQDEFIKKLLEIVGVNRRPTSWDRENISVWTSWNFSEEMILEAGKLASGKASPIAYMNGILSNWKNNGIFNVKDVPEKSEVNKGEVSAQEYNREYKNRRALAISKAERNLDKARELNEFNPLYERTFSIEKDLADAEISGNVDKQNQLENEKIHVFKSLENLLKTIGLTIDDLTPQYSCKKCLDTGYVGTHRCDCFKK